MVWFMALAAAFGTAVVYPLQPAVAQVAGSLHTAPAAIGAALAGGPIGYLLGLALLVPLVDRHPPRHVLSLHPARSQPLAPPVRWRIRRGCSAW